MRSPVRIRGRKINQPPSSWNIVLFAPQIPQNTGNIARTCAATGAHLHLIKPLGFSLENRWLRRAGLDYWPLVEVSVYDNLDEFFHQNSNGNFFYLTKYGSKSYAQIEFSGDVFLVFGQETYGLPLSLLEKNPERCYRIPMVEEARSLNLSNAVAIVLYEGLRQHNFAGLKISRNLAETRKSHQIQETRKRSSRKPNQ
ncbi:MAG: tRNA (uridine(34)/cytosine(34)/5-carboxymethylaminomethyluridine(34)-2'-O)-methyltransferase TrmL [Candidatus Aminicenantes bacterium 4484_214]|nr:MAG: tRNA (uridine(34)/cytosine(34)/5-carboxymethylaminomethyluridine(34)-2'-O)-methyltransferase TrmL [Candidatus Aminicenantes bacterium 4484_214]RLE10584.1 MAG: tRNA (uridine(34)/cytosine(34)/5-carboxymethylaminomethyluridine(34)-2'-O)-methyltransferase TrmL [Candidatus Aminicenantes bacterium]